MYEKNQKYTRGLRTSGLRGQFKALSKKIPAEFSDGTCRTRLFAKNGGEKALNRCDVPALQRKDLEQTAKEEPYSLQTVGYGWVRRGGVCGGKGPLWVATKKDLCKWMAFGLRKRATFSAHAKPPEKEKLFSAHRSTNFALHPN